MAAAQEHWIAIRVKPGYQRTASQYQAANEEFRMESFIERNLRIKHFDVFMPAFYIEAKHHRTKLWMRKRFPILVGYAFVNLPELNFEELRAVEGVMCVLKPVRDKPPVKFSLSDIEFLKAAEEKAYEQFLRERNLRIEAERAAQNKVSRRDMKKMFPPNSTAMIADGKPFEGLLARVLGPSSRGKVKAVIETLNGFTSVDIPLENLRRAS